MAKCPTEASSSRQRVLSEVAAQAREYLVLEHMMGTPGIPEVAVARMPVEAAAPDNTDEPEKIERPMAGRGAYAPEERERRLRSLAQEAAECRDCVLHERRNRNVFARGDSGSEIVFVGEGPGRDEDRVGLPFVGAAGQLLDKMVAAMGYQRDEVYICNVVKCRPPDNRTPRPEEALACARFLRPQLQLVAPKVIVALGRCAAEHLGVAKPEGPWRGRWGTYGEIPVMPTYHPAFLLRSPQFKRVVWTDLQAVMARLGRPVTAPARS